MRTSVFGITEIGNPLLFLGIYADYRAAVSLKMASSSRQHAKLPVALRILGFGQTFAVGPQRILLLAQQAGHRSSSNPHAAPSQGRPQIAQRFVRPSQATHRIARGRILEQLVQEFLDARTLFSTRLRPAPTRRMRPQSLGCACSHSRYPRRIVTRVNPVISRTRWIPPLPRCLANTPANSRRLRSSSSTITRLIERWYSMTSR